MRVAHEGRDGRPQGVRGAVGDPGRAAEEKDGSAGPGGCPAERPDQRSPGDSSRERRALNPTGPYQRRAVGDHDIGRIEETTKLAVTDRAAHDVDIRRHDPTPAPARQALENVLDRLVSGHAVDADSHQLVPVERFDHTSKSRGAWVSYKEFAVASLHGGSEHSHPGLREWLWMRIGLLSDAHGNLEAFDVARRVLERMGVDDVFFLGDAVGYFPGSVVVEAVVRDNITAVLGNHEAMLLDLELTARNDDAYQLRRTASGMPESLVEAIRNWPTTRTLQLAHGPALLVHGSPDDPTFGYVYPDTELHGMAANPELDGTTIFMGNTHRPFVRVCGSTVFVNVGSCGLPRDVGTLGSCCIFDDSTSEVRILRFDIHDATARALVRCEPVHESVRRVTTRETSDYVGELVTSEV